MASSPDRCATRGCDSHAAGHRMHWIHAKHVGAAPWGWRDGVVESVSDGWADVRYLRTGTPVRVWHHEPLGEILAVGEPVRVHEGLHALGGPCGWLNVAVHRGLGAVDDPADPSRWAPETTGGVVDAVTGRALPLDHPSVPGAMLPVAALLRLAQADNRRPPAPQATVTPCADPCYPCHSHRPGHRMSWPHARTVGLRPWGWREAVVVQSGDGWARLRYRVGGEVSVWHHRALPAPGTPVRVHEGRQALDADGQWLSVCLRGGLGPAAAPQTRDELVPWLPLVTGARIRPGGTGVPAPREATLRPVR